MKQPMPLELPTMAVAYGHGHKGMAFHVYRNDEYGLQLEARRESRGAAWVQIFSIDCMPNRTFKTFEEMRQAFNELAILPPPFKPVIESTEPRDVRGTGACWLCREPHAWLVRVKTGWRSGNISLICSCDACLPAVQQDPLAAIAARRQWVRAHPPARFGS